jgi:hypothetical protein
LQLRAFNRAGIIYFPDLALPLEAFLDFDADDFGLMDSPFFAALLPLALLFFAVFFMFNCF